MRFLLRRPSLSLTRRLVVVLFICLTASTIHAVIPNGAEEPIRRFLAQDDTQPSYRAVRHLEAENRSRTGWLDAITEYAPATGFRYVVTAEGGSGYIRSKVLRGLLDAERDAIAHGEVARSSLALDNYTFEAKGIGPDGLAYVLLSPRRKEKILVSGMMALNVDDGALVRLEGRLARNPSFWVKKVDIVRTYERIGGTVVPVALDSKAKLRFLGDASLRMTYTYSEINGAPVSR